MIPIKDHNSTTRFPLINLLLILVCTIVFFVSVFADFESIINQFGFIPQKFSQNYFSHLPNLLFALFLHGSFVHLFFNMLYLYIFGDNIENLLGKFLYLFSYLFLGIMASLGQFLLDPASALPHIGASGAISGIMGMYLILFPGATIQVLLPYSAGFYTQTVTARQLLIFWILIQLVSSSAQLAGSNSNIAYGAHIGGFICGVILAKILQITKFYKNKNSRLSEYGL